MKIKSLLFAVLAMASLLACKKDEPVVEPVLELSSTNININSYGGERILNITANNAWTVAADAEWVSFSEESGEASDEKQSITVYIDEYTGQEARTAKITVTAGSLTKEIAVTQAAAEVEPEQEPETELTLSTATLASAAEGGESTFTVTSNKAWTAATEADWVTLAPTAGEASEEAVTVTVTVVANADYVERTAVITVTADDAEQTVTLIQAAAEEPEVPLEGSGTEADPYVLKTAKHMESMRELAVLEGETWFKMANDIDLASITNWVPVNFDQGYKRKIHFDGGNFTLSNFVPQSYTLTKEDGTEEIAGYHSLFGIMYGSCKNLKVNNVTINGSNACGVIGGYVGTTGLPGLVENVTITNASITNSGDRAGGVCGNAKEATFRNVSFQGSVTSTYTAKEAKSGGFVGHTETTAVFENCSADVVVAGASNDLGGFVGKTTGEVSFTGCEVKAAVTSNKNEKNRCGGFLGWNSSAKATFTDCHVLQGSTITNSTNRGSKSNGNFGGFIGFGDTTGSVVKISGCSANVDITVDSNAGYNGGFIGGSAYQSTIDISDCWAAGSVNGGDYVGGFYGAVQNKVSITRCWSSVTVNASGQRVGGLVGVANIASGVTDAGLTITDCYSTGNVASAGQQVGGILGYAQTALPKILRCFATGDITSHTAGTGGIVGTLSKEGSEVSKCIAWNKNIDCKRSAANKWAPGAVVGAASVKVTLTDCYRRADMNLVDAAGAMTLYDQENIVNASPEQPAYVADLTDNQTAQQAYHGKAAAADATISSVAKTLGWDETVWDLSGSVPTLK